MARDGSMTRNAVFLAVVCLAAVVPELTMAQVPPASTSSIGGQAAESTDAMVHKDLSGKPCLKFEANGRAHVINPKLFDHVIVANNHCSQLITVKVCYLKSDRCVQLGVPGYGRKEAVLGIMPSMSQFRYDFKEQF
jgi:hypothetical protein